VGPRNRNRRRTIGVTGGADHFVTKGLGWSGREEEDGLDVVDLYEKKE